MTDAITIVVYFGSHPDDKDIGAETERGVFAGHPISWRRSRRTYPGMPHVREAFFPYRYTEGSIETPVHVIAAARDEQRLRQLQRGLEHAEIGPQGKR